MEEVFNSFCAFGDHSKGGVHLLDGSKFAKLCRDSKILDKKLTATDVDIIFSRPEVKQKSERKINYKQFQKALELMADKKYPGEEDRVEKLKAKLLEAKGPATHGATKAVKSSAVDRLTDTSKYTGSHKERFDDSGKGKGISGRKDKPEGSGYVSGYKNKDTFDTSH